MRRKTFVRLIVAAIVIMLAGYIFVKPAFNYLSRYLSKTEQVQANILLVEGWLSESDLDIVYSEYKQGNYDKIITTGLTYVDEYFNMYENGYLIFYPSQRNAPQDKISSHSISVNAYGSLNTKEYAHFDLYINTSLIADFSADKHRRKYSVRWEGAISAIDSLMIHFTNDRKDEFGDLNLLVKDVVIDDTIRIPYLHNSEYDISELDGNRRVVNDFNSTAERARNWLLSRVTDSTKIIAVPGGKVRINRTLTSALAFRDWLKTTKIDIKGINIISSGTHARRTWMTYNRILDEKYGIGIISISGSEYSGSKIGKVLKTLREAIGIIYYWFILIPY
jgi:hypothetical protein